MEIPLQITSSDFPLSEAIERKLRTDAGKLDKLYERITRCRIVVESPHHHRQKGRQYSINIYMTLPGSELVVKRAPNEDLYVAIRDSFKAARRKLEDFSRQQRGDVKHHEEAPHWTITALSPEKGYGLLTTPDNMEVYFHAHSIINNDFKHFKDWNEGAL